MYMRLGFELCDDGKAKLDTAGSATIDIGVTGFMLLGRHALPKILDELNYFYLCVRFILMSDETCRTPTS